MAEAIVLILRDLDPHEQIGKDNIIYPGDQFSWVKAGRECCVFTFTVNSELNAS